MKNNRIRTAITLSIALGIIAITAYAVNQQASIRGAAKAGNISLLVNVVQKPDGSFDGRATFRNSLANTRTDIQINCVSFNNASFCGLCDPAAKFATLTGVITSSNDPNFGLEPVGFTVQDFGHGKGSPPDQFTPLVLAKTPCWPFLSAFLESEGGQIFVNDGQ